MAEAAWRQCGLDRVDLVVSTVTLGKEGADAPTAIAHRVRALHDVVAGRPWLGVAVVDHQLVADIAEGYDVVVLGADKWAQVNEVHWYGDEAARDAALARLPHVAVAPRPPHPSPRAGTADVTVLAVDPAHHPVSATEVRAGRLEWLAPGITDEGWRSHR